MPCNFYYIYNIIINTVIHVYRIALCICSLSERTCLKAVSRTTRMLATRSWSTKLISLIQTVFESMQCTKRQPYKLSTDKLFDTMHPQNYNPHRQFHVVSKKLAHIKVGFINQCNEGVFNPVSTIRRTPIPFKNHYCTNIFKQYWNIWTQRIDGLLSQFRSWGSAMTHTLHKTRCSSFYLYDGYIRCIINSFEPVHGSVLK